MKIWRNKKNSNRDWFLNLFSFRFTKNSVSKGNHCVSKINVDFRTLFFFSFITLIRNHNITPLPLGDFTSSSFKGESRNFKQSVLRSVRKIQCGHFPPGCRISHFTLAGCDQRKAYGVIRHPSSRQEILLAKTPVPRPQDEAFTVRLRCRRPHRRRGQR